MPRRSTHSRARTVSGGRSWLRALLVPSCAGALLSGASPALAQAPAEAVAAADDAAASVELFRQGRGLLNKGRFKEACDMFQRSLVLRRSPGTLLNVGNCLESSGDLIGALRAFEETQRLAQAEPDARKAEVWTTAAREESEALAPRIPHVVVGALDASDVRVMLDGEALTVFAEPVALNPGAHVVAASAEGKLAFERRFELVASQTLSVEIPPLEPAAPVPAHAAPVRPASAPATAASRSPVAAGGPSHVVPWVITGVGGAVLVAGAMTGLVAAQRASALKRECPNHQCEADLSAPHAVRDTALVADVLLAVGFAGVAVGATWLLWPEQEASPSLGATCSLTACSAGVSGRF
jgi:hypothetical protein